MNGLQINDNSAFGVFAATSAIIACDIYVMLNTYNWDWLFVLIVLISIALVYVWTGIYTLFLSSTTFYRVGGQVYGALIFWAYLLVTVVASLLPQFTYKSICRVFFPADVDIIREQVKAGLFKDILTSGKSVADQETQQDVEMAIASNSTAGDHEKDNDDTALIANPPNDLIEPRPDLSQRRDSDWRTSFSRPSSEGVRLSLDIPEITTARSLLSRVETQ